MDNLRSGEKDVIAIIGTGLIGCSMAEGLRDISEEIIGVDNNTSHLQEALGRGWIDKSMSLENAIAKAGIVVVTLPVDATIRLLPGILEGIDSRAVVIDAGSVKSAICKNVENHPGRPQFVASHPMAGLAVSGPDAAGSRLFMNRKVIICEHERSSGHALDIARLVFGRLGLKIIYMDPELHDVCVGRVSHLPQVISYCLSAINQGDEGKPLTGVAATGYESLTRLASSPAGMWIPILQHNRDNLISSLDEMISGLSDIRNMIDQEHWQRLEQLIEKANKSREQFLSEYNKQS